MLLENYDTSVQILGAFANLPSPESEGKDINRKTTSNSARVPHDLNFRLPQGSNTRIPQESNSKLPQNTRLPQDLNPKLPTSRNFFQPRENSLFPINHSLSNGFILNDGRNSIDKKFRTESNDISVRDPHSTVGHSLFVNSNENDLLNTIFNNRNSFSSDGPIIIHTGNNEIDKSAFNSGRNLLRNDREKEDKFGPVITTIHGGPDTPSIVIPHSFNRKKSFNDPNISSNFNIGIPKHLNQFIRYPPTFPTQKSLISQNHRRNPTNVLRPSIIQIPAHNPDTSGQFSSRIGQVNSIFTTTLPFNTHGNSFFPRQLSPALSQIKPRNEVETITSRKIKNRLNNERRNDKRQELSLLFNPDTRPTQPPVLLHSLQEVRQAFRWRPSRFPNSLNKRPSNRKERKKFKATTVSGL